MANAYCLWRRSKSPMQSNIPPLSLPLRGLVLQRTNFSTTHHVCVPCYIYGTPCHLFATSVNSFCHALNGARIACLPSRLPCATSLSPFVSVCLYLARISRVPSLAVNDIYAILIEISPLYMRMHTQASFSSFSFSLRVDEGALKLRTTSLATNPGRLTAVNSGSYSGHGSPMIDLYARIGVVAH